MRILSALSLARRPALAFAIVGLFWGTFAASVPDLKRGLGASDGLFGTLLLGTAFGLLTAMWLAPRVDVWLGRRGLQVAAACFAALFVAPALAPTPGWFFVALLAMGTFSGLLDVLMNARVSELEARHGRSLMNVSHGMFSVAYAAAAFATGVIRDVGGEPITALALVAGVSFLLTLGLAIAPDVEAQSSGQVSNFPLLLVGLCGGIVFVAFLVEATVETWSALHIERTLGGDALIGALGPTILGLTMAVGRIGGQGLSDRLDDRLVIVVASALAALGAVIVAVARTPGEAYVGFGALGLGISVVGPLGLALVGRMVPARHRTRAISVAAVMGFSGFFIAPVLMGGVSELFGLRFAYGAVSV
ncbi:MAG: MFS transporter, partial [Shimia sp.]